MKKNPAVSVIVPLYKVEKYVKQCVDSILAQTFKDFEIILVDDASPDGCFELCQKLYGDNPKVKLIRQEEKRGVGEVRNDGLNHAVGKYVCFVDGDDFISPATLEKLYDTAEKNNADVVHAAGHYEFAPKGDEAPSVKNLQIKWDNYSAEGFLENDALRLLENYQKFYDIRADAWLQFCRRDFLEKNQIRFLPTISADELFGLALFCTAERFYILHEAFYIRRLRADSIARSRDVEKFSDGIQAMLLGAPYIEKILPANDKEILRKKFTLNFFEQTANNYTAPFYADDKTAAAANNTAGKILSPSFGELTPFVQYFFSGYHMYRRQTELLLQEVQNVTNQYSAQIVTVFNRLELSNNKIVFVSFRGRGYGCNPKYIAEEILRQNLPYDLVWLVNDMNEPMPAKIRKVKYGGVNSMYELATAKVIVSNTRAILPFPNKKLGQFFIMTWHGWQGLKLVEKDAGDKIAPFYVAVSKANSTVTDLMMTGTQDMYEECRRAFWYDGEILQCGLPRNDIFFRRDENLIAQIRQRLKIPPENKIVMYAPTFRNEPEVMKKAYCLDTKKLLNALKKRFGGEWTLLMRFHPNAASIFSSVSFGDDIINVTYYPDMQELILISDVLISDYSSVICDFMFTGKKVFIFAGDFDSYTKERGFKPLYFELPYKVNRSEEELFNDIETFDAVAVEPKVKRFIDTVKPFDDGHASEKVVARIKAVITNVIPPPQR